MTSTAALLTAVEIVGDVALKQGNAPLGFAVYNMLAYLLYTRLPGQSLALVNGYWDAFSNLATFAAGTVLFSESYSPTQVLGFALISCGIFLITPRN